MHTSSCYVFTRVQQGYQNHDVSARLNDVSCRVHVCSHWVSSCRSGAILSLCVCLHRAGTDQHIPVRKTMMKKPTRATASPPPTSSPPVPSTHLRMLCPLRIWAVSRYIHWRVRAHRCFMTICFHTTTLNIHGTFLRFQTIIIRMCCSQVSNKKTQWPNAEIHQWS